VKTPIFMDVAFCRSVERGVYFDAWFPRQHCYHPSLPPRRLRMIDHLEDYRATTLVWAALGGGSISLPFLEEEAFADVDARYRFYGFVNDAEFVAECARRGIKVFGIVFEVQGWELPVELNADEDRILALNEVRGDGARDWLGLREFSQNRYPKLWKAFEHYFPGGLVNSAGERVTDLIEECVSRDIHGNALHARWVECPDREHECYLMDRNNPVWREYLKAVIRIQIDAGVAGVQLDEAELPLTALQYGGCFCRDCMAGFRAYLEERRPGEVAGVDLSSFHYGEWLLAQGWDFKKRQHETPLFWEYVRFQRGQITRYFAELCEYARTYAASKGREVLVSGNFFNLYDQYYSLEPQVDLIITEMRNTTYRQPDWYRYVAGFARGKPVIVVENPYGGVVPELVDALAHGRGYDRFRLSLYEAAALGANMSVPYGSWLGSVIEDSFYAPHELCIEIQSHLAENDHLFSAETYSEVAVVYSVRSMSRLMAERDAFADNRTNLSADVSVPYLEACRALSDLGHPYDVLFFPDGELRGDELTPADLAQYRTLVLPGCSSLTAAQVQLVRAYLDDGGCVLVLGAFDDEHADLLEHAGATRAERLSLDDLAGGAQVVADGADELVVCIHRIERGAAIHLLRYAYDEEADAAPALPALSLEVRLPSAFSSATATSPGGPLPVRLTPSGGNRHRLELAEVPLFATILLEP
jgi:hypothetical protein